jgi:hypothetical protein
MSIEKGDRQIGTRSGQMPTDVADDCAAHHTCYLWSSLLSYAKPSTLVPPRASMSECEKVRMELVDLRWQLIRSRVANRGARTGVSCPCEDKCCDVKCTVSDKAQNQL